MPNTHIETSFGLTSCEFSDINRMHVIHEFHRAPRPSLGDDTFKDFRLNFLKEELVETAMAWDQGNLPEVLDGLVDLVVVAIGTADLLSLPWEEAWNTVLEANLKKVPRKTARGYSFIDLQKPRGWTRPDHKYTLLKAGWDPANQHQDMAKLQLDRRKVA